VPADWTALTVVRPILAEFVTPVIQVIGSVAPIPIVFVRLTALYRLIVLHIMLIVMAVLLALPAILYLAHPV